MILVTIQDNLYLSWQVELLIYNIYNLNPNEVVIILSGYKNRPTEHSNNLVSKFKGIYQIKDTRENMHYAPSIQPHLITKFLKTGSYKNEPVFLIDSDVYLKSLNMLKFSEKNVTFSDTSSYLNASYINGTDPDILKHMCSIVNVDYDFVMSCDYKSGGAHYLLPNLFDIEFWETVEVNCFKLYDFMCKYKCKNHEIQKWTASMWVILWELYKREINGSLFCSSTKKLDFCWGTDNINRFDQTEILHMAGVTENLNKTHFYKGDYTINPPWNKDYSYLNKDLCGYKYAEFITEYSKIRNDFTTL